MRFLVFRWILIMAYYLLMRVSTVSGKLCLDDQRSLLLQLNNNLVYDPKASSKLAHWNLQNPDCCTWNGVGCDSAGHVISLHLDNESISDGIQNSTLFSLVHLKILNLALNTMHMEIPKGIKTLTNLASLNFSGSGFTGQIPVEIWTLRSLTTLDLSTRKFPFFNRLKLENPDLIMLTQNLSSLTELYLDYVQISVSARDWFQALSLSLPGLRILSLRSCGIQGPLEYSAPFHHRLLSVIHLDHNNLTKVPDFLTNLPNLSTLTLSSCSLEGAFPSMIFQMTTLENLDLSSNEGLNGVIPPLPQDGSLRTLDLGFTSFSGSLPDSLGYHRMLSKIVLTGCNFSGPISSTIGNLTELVYMALSFNQFTGPIPPFHTAEKLRLAHIDLRFNSLDGSIPPSLFRLPSLEVLSLSSNKLNGAVQFEMFPNLSNLTFLDLGRNNLTVDGRTVNSWSLKYPKLEDLYLASCNVNAFPNLRGLSQLVSLDLSDNLIGGKIPSWVWEIGSGQMQYLNLSGNHLVGLQSPYELSSNLEILDLHSNRICDQFPVTPASATYVDYSNNNFQGPFQIRSGSKSYPGQFLFLANNNLSGEIPTSLCKAGYFTVLHLSGNLLNGTIPPCLLKRIEGVLNLGRNNLTGEIPHAFPDDCGIQTLDLGWNHLGGKLPSSLANCKHLQVLNVGENEIHDTFPCMLNASFFLRVLVLRSNRFYGNMTCSGADQIWPKLQIIDAASNNFTGDLNLKYISSWRRMMEEETLEHDYGYSRIFFTSDAVKLTMKGQQVNPDKILNNVLAFSSIDFSNNNFSGKIPEIFGKLKSIYFLNLSHNSLTGRIPKSLGNLRQLEWLDISSNQLTGEIPNGLGRLSFLSVLNVSYNYLVGKIPEGGQFQTFTEESFEGNLRLCGFPLSTSCDLGIPATRTTASSVSDVEYDWRFLFVGLGYSVGLIGVVASLTLYGPWRERFNDEVDKYLEMVFSGRRNRMRKRGRRGR